MTSTERVRLWRLANPTRQQHNQRAYAKKHAEKIKAADAARYAADKDTAKRRARSHRYMKVYGITIEQFELAMVHQRGLCAICGREPTPGRRLHADHDHKTKRVRGLLCHFCNLHVLGRGCEVPELHLAAAEYLESDYDIRSF